jgi:tetratricopeptide (TPR) repeat protein
MTFKRAFAIALAAAFIAAPSLAEEKYSSGLYEYTYPEGMVGIEEVADACNALRAAMNDVFRFDSIESTRVSKIVILSDQQAFEQYVAERIGETRSQYLLLRYSDPARSELVLYPRALSSGYAAFSGPSLNRQLFLQYLYASVAEPPLWIRDGFQALFENLSWDTGTKLVSYDTNSPWLETAKAMAADTSRRYSLTAILSALTGTYDSAQFYPQSWAFVSFLVTSEHPEYQRFLYETSLILAGLAPFNTNTQKENTDAVLARFSGFNDPVKADEDYLIWLSAQHTFNELVQAGVSDYNAGMYESAQKTLAAAISMRGTDPLATYYLGLVAYALKEYAHAELWYRKALEYGGDVSTVNWALGLNAYADKRFAEAKVYLETAKQANPARYGTRVTDLLSSMPK